MGLTFEDVICMNKSQHDTPSEHLIRSFTDWRFKVWKGMNFWTTVCVSVVAPLSFTWGGSWRDTMYVPGGHALLIVDLICDVFYAVHLLLKLNASYYDKTRHVEIIDRSMIVRRLLVRPIYWLSWISTTVHLWAALFQAPLILNCIKIIRIRHLTAKPAA